MRYLKPINDAQRGVLVERTITSRDDDRRGSSGKTSISRPRAFMRIGSRVRRKGGSGRGPGKLPVQSGKQLPNFDVAARARAELTKGPAGPPLSSIRHSALPALHSRDNNATSKRPWIVARDLFHPADIIAEGIAKSPEREDRPKRRS